jgi:hypothetical protein
VLTKEQLLAKRRVPVELDLGGGERFTVHIKPVLLTDFLQFKEELPAVYQMIAGTIGGQGPAPQEGDDPLRRTLQGYDFMLAVVLAGVVEPRLSLRPDPGELSPRDLEPFGTGEGQAMPNLRRLSEAILGLSDLDIAFRPAGEPAGVPAPTAHPGPDA